METDISGKPNSCLSRRSHHSTQLVIRAASPPLRPLIHEASREHTDRWRSTLWRQKIYQCRRGNVPGSVCAALSAMRKHTQQIRKEECEPAGPESYRRRGRENKGMRQRERQRGGANWIEAFSTKDSSRSTACFHLNSCAPRSCWSVSSWFSSDVSAQSYNTYEGLKNVCLFELYWNMCHT